MNVDAYSIYILSDLVRFQHKLLQCLTCYVNDYGILLFSILNITY